MKRPNKKDYDLGMTNEAISYAWDLGEYADYLEEQIKKGQTLPIDSVRLSLFNEVYNKFVECENDDEFTQYLNENTNEA
jgi:hypothetical protein